MMRRGPNGSFFRVVAMSDADAEPCESVRLRFIAGNVVKGGDMMARVRLSEMQEPKEWASRLRRFADSIDKIYEKVSNEP